MFALLAIACGSVLVEINTEVIDENDVRHDLVYEIQGPAAMGMQIEVGEGLDEVPEGCEVTVSVDSVRLTCVGLSQSEARRFMEESPLSSEVSDEEVPFNGEVSKEDKGSHWEYKASLKNPFYGLNEEIMAGLTDEENAMLQGVDLSQGFDAILKLRLKWSVTMPGEVLDSNGDSSEDEVTSFTVTLDDGREDLFVVSRVDKPGACNR